MDHETQRDASEQPVFVGFEAAEGAGAADASAPDTAGDWTRELRGDLSRIRERAREAGGELELLFVEVFATAEAEREAVRAELRAALGADTPVVAVTPATVLPNSRRVALEAILVPAGDRVEANEVDGLPGALRIGRYFMAHARGSIGESTTEKIRQGLAEVTDAFAVLDVTPGDVVKYNVFYRGDGTREEWAEPVKERASLFTGPGPCTTGIPVREFEDPRVSVQLQLFGKANARRENDTVAVRPADHWDWPVPLPYFHGNRVGDLMLVGGQVSLAPDSQVIDVGDLPAQVRRSVRYIATILGQLGGNLGEVTRVTAFYEAAAEGDGDAIRSALAAAMPPGAEYEVSLIGFDKLSYPDMLVEIECQARRRS